MSMKKLVILDLDETLIYATKTSVGSEYFKVGDYFVYRREHLDDFLEFCNEYFQVGIWTSSTKNYAHKIVEEIATNIDISFIFSRESCVVTRDLERDTIVYIKDLKKIKRKGFNLDNVLVVDVSPEKLQRNYGNLIKVKPFFGEKDDELLQLRKYLQNILDVSNFRTLEKRYWKRKSHEIN